MRMIESVKYGSMFGFLCFASLLFGAENSPSLPKPPSKSSDATCEMCNTMPSLSAISETKWINVGDRIEAKFGEEVITNQNGKTFRIKELFGLPTVITFLYTHCTNPNKCPLAATTMASLQGAVQKAGIESKVRLCIMTYDPENDSDVVLSSYANARGIKCNDNFMTLRPDPKCKKDLFEKMNVSVNYEKNGVNIHGIQLLILDANGRLAKSYHSLIWNNDRVLNDLKALLAEPPYNAKASKVSE